MAYIRREDLDWTVPIGEADDSLPSFSSPPEAIIAAGAVWVTRAVFSGDWTNYLEGFDLTTGASVGSVVLPDDGSTIQYPAGMALDQNGYIWLPAVGPSTRCHIINPVTKTIVTTINTADFPIVHFDPILNAMWVFHSLNIGSGTYRAYNTTDYTFLKDITIPRTNQNALGRAVDPIRGRLWFQWGANTIKVYDTTTGLETNSLTSLFPATWVISYIPELDAMLFHDVALGYELWDAETLTKTLSTGVTEINFGAFYDPNTGGIVGKFNGPGIYDTWPGTFSLTPPHTTTHYSDTSGIATKDMQNGVYTVDPVDGSIYLRLFDDNGFTFYVHKIAFGPAPTCFHVTGAGGKNRCDGTPPTTPIANNRNAPYV